MFHRQCQSCNKWQESRNACFYDENNRTVVKIIHFIFGCEKYKTRR